MLDRIAEQPGSTLDLVPDTQHQDVIASTIRPRGPWLIAFTGAVVVLLVVGALWWFVAREPAGQPNLQGSGTCIGWYTPESDEQCLRAGVDQAKRQPISDEQRAEADAVMDDLSRVLMRLGRCMSPEGEPCPGSVVPRPATESDANNAIQKFGEVGLSSTTVRVARPEDPAPPGSLFFAVELPSRGCIVGHLEKVPGGAGNKAIVGSLPDGRCAAA